MPRFKSDSIADAGIETAASSYSGSRGVICARNSGSESGRQLRVVDEATGQQLPLIFSKLQNDGRVLHGFATRKQAEAYLSSDLFTKDVVVGLKSLLKADPEVRIYSAD